MNSYPNSSTTTSSPNSNYDGQNMRRKRKLLEQICSVCGDEAYSDKFGAPACLSCTKFFQKNTRCQQDGKCQITIGTRTNCVPCRLKKCEEVGMKNQVTKTKCEVCGQPSSLANRNGVTCCHACHSFAKIPLAWKKLPGKFCPSGDCQIDQFNRTNCPSCRYKKYWRPRVERNCSESLPDGTSTSVSPATNFSSPDHCHEQLHFAQTTVSQVPQQIYEQSIYEPETFHAQSAVPMEPYDDQMEFQTTVTSSTNFPSIDRMSANTATISELLREPLVDQKLPNHKILECEICGQQCGVANKTRRHKINSCLECYWFFTDLFNGKTLLDRNCKFHGNCQINQENRNKCPACRYNKYMNLKIERSRCQKPIMYAPVPSPQFYDQGHYSEQGCDRTGILQYDPIIPKPESLVCQGEEWNLQQNSEYPGPKLDSIASFDPEKIQFDLHDYPDEELDNAYSNQLLKEVHPDPEDRKQEMYPNNDCRTPEPEDIECPSNYPPTSPAKYEQSWNLQLDGLISPEKCYPSTSDGMEYQDPG